MPPLDTNAAEIVDPNEALAPSGLAFEALKLWNAGAVVVDTIKTLDETKSALGMPVHISMEELADMGELVYLAADYVARVANPGYDASKPVDEENRPFSDGWYVTVGDPDTMKVYGCFIGGVALKRDIGGVVAANAFPFRASLTRNGTGRGHPWMFA